MNGKLKDSNVDFLFKAVLALENIDECYDFFEDLCTVTELKALSQRIVVAKMLSDKQRDSQQDRRKHRHDKPRQPLAQLRLRRIREDIRAHRRRRGREERLIMSEYSFFARFYDELTQNVDYERRAEHFSALLLSYGIKSGTVLDLACGTGTLTSLISARGYDMIGVDSSPDMLSQAQNRAFEEGQNILFLCQQMQALDLFGKIDAALCTLDSINHLTEPDDVRETFRRLGTFIRPGGMFIFDVNTIYKHREILADNSFVYEYPDVFCVWQNSLDEETDTVDIMLDFFEENEDGTYERTSEDFSERAYSLDELSKWLGDAGFDIENIYDGITNEPVREDSERAVIAARRRK